jgi:preprotein translocase subunit SecD
MKIILTLIVILISFSCNKNWEHTGNIKLEFRIAETKPANKLIKMSMYNTGDIFYVHNYVLLTNNDIKSAKFTTWQTRPGIELHMTDSGRVKWAKITEENIGRNIGMILNGKLVCAPLVRAKIDAGVAIINGIFTEEEAREIAAGILRE